MTKPTQRLSVRRVAAIAISCTALIAVAIGPTFAAGGSFGASPALTGLTEAVRLQLLQAETVDADANEIAELDGMIDPDGQDATDNTENVVPPVADTPEPTDSPEPTDTPEPTEAPHVKATTKATTKVTTRAASTRVEEADDNDDQGENQQDNQQASSSTGEHDGGDSGKQSGGGSGGD
jgi:outer membrane biosynthesis protein TonB